MPDTEAQFAALREAYEDAFRRFAREVQVLQSLLGSSAPDMALIEDARRRVEEARALYRRRRDALARVLLSGLKAQPSTINASSVRAAASGLY